MHPIRPTRGRRVASRHVVTQQPERDGPERRAPQRNDPGRDGPERDPPETPEFGPRGYLPSRAARRARKIVLRSPLGLQWLVATVLAGVVVLVAGVLFLTRATSPPGEPFVAAGRLAEMRPATVTREALVVTSGGRVRAFAVGDAAPRWCPASRRLESAGGRVWSLTGRALDGGPSLPAHPTVVHDGVVYLDPTTTVPPPEAEDRSTAPACAPGELVPAP